MTWRRYPDRISPRSVAALRAVVGMYPGMGFILTAKEENVEEVCHRFADVGITAAPIGKVDGSRRLAVRYLGRETQVFDFWTRRVSCRSLRRWSMPVTVGLGAASPTESILSTVRVFGHEVDLVLFSQPGTAGSFGDAVKVIEAEQPEEALVAGSHRRQD